jgi:2-isopropylmalate synthase
MKITTFDTTLRDGTQGEAVSFSVEDKLIIARKLDELGIDYIEGGWPGSNPKDKEFFSRAKQELRLKHAKLCAFGATHFARYTVDTDPSVRELIDAETPAISIFGKTWDFHVTRALGITLEENLTIISNTVRFLKQHGREVIYDAEHFFDGYKHNPEYALLTIQAAWEAGADVVCLCDTNGGTLPGKVSEIVAVVRNRFSGILGIHPHNDSDVAVANALAAVEAGCTHVQGCMNGYGERCGNANLISVLANLEIKMGHTTIGAEALRNLTSVAHFIADLANLPVRNDQAYIGKSAFAHKGGIHVSAVLKDSATYEHIPPDLVGNQQRVLLSDMSGRGNIFYKLKEQGLGAQLTENQRRHLLDQIKQLEHEGYELEAAEGTFELMVRETLNPGRQFFNVVSLDVATKMGRSGGSLTVATVSLQAGDGLHTETAVGNGPVNALDLSLRQCLAGLYPEIASVKLADYKVRVIDSKKGTDAKVRVLIEWHDRERTWVTVGVSDNVIEASWKAMVDAIRLELMRLADAATDSAQLASTALSTNRYFAVD